MGGSCYFAFLREGVTSEQDLKGENHAKVQEKHVQSSEPSPRLMCLAVYSRYSKVGCISGVLETLVHTLKSQLCSPLPKSMFSHACSLKSAMEEEFKSCKSTNMTNESFSPSILPLFPCTRQGRVVVLRSSQGADLTSMRLVHMVETWQKCYACFLM